MILSATCTESDVSERAPIIYRGGLDEILGAVKEAGYQGAEVHIRNSDMIDRGRLKDALERFGLELTSIGTGEAYGKDRLFLASEDSSVRKGAIERICGHIRTAKDYPHAVVILGLVRGKIKDCSSRESYEYYQMESLKECVEEAEKYGVVLGIEMMNRYECDNLNRICEGLELAERLDSSCVGLHIDTYHMNIEEGNIREAIFKAGSRIVHVHAADNDRWYPGHGHFDFSQVMQTLKDIDYPYGVAVECLSRPDAVTAGREAAAYMRKWF